jgi:hypothetical protein
LLSGLTNRLTCLTNSGWVVGLLPGPREVFLVALVVLALYGRSELARRGFARLFRPWTTRPAGANGVSKPSWLSDRWFLLIAIVASAAVAAWVVTWMTVVHRPPGPR